MTKPLPIRFSGTGAYLPKHVLTNQHFIDHLDTSDEWIVSRTGIRERRRAAKDETTSTLALHAARRALKDADMSAEEIDLIVVATATGDCPFPSTAAFVQDALGARQVPSFDVSAACSGFLHATSVAASMLVAGPYEHAMVIGAETLTRFVDPEDRTSAVLMGDGAGAAVLSKTLNPQQSILHAALGCDGSRAKHIWVPAGGSLLPASANTVAERLHYMKMRGRYVYKISIVKMQQIIDEALKATNLTANDLKLVIPHQSNLRIIESVRQRMGLPEDKIAVNIVRYGNTSAASIPVALDEARHDGTLTEGDHVLMVAIGAGLTWATMVVRL